MDTKYSMVLDTGHITAGTCRLYIAGNVPRRSLLIVSLFSSDTGQVSFVPWQVTAGEAGSAGLRPSLAPRYQRWRHRQEPGSTHRQFTWGSGLAEDAT